MAETEAILKEDVRLEMIDEVALEMSELPQVASAVEESLEDGKISAIKRLRTLITNEPSLEKYKEKIDSIPISRKAKEGGTKASNEFMVANSVVDLMSPDE